MLNKELFETLEKISEKYIVYSPTELREYVSLWSNGYFIKEEEHYNRLVKLLKKLSIIC